MDQESAAGGLATSVIATERCKDEWQPVFAHDSSHTNRQSPQRYCVSDSDRLKNLTILRLSKTPITDMGIKELGELRNLTSLDLGGTRVTDGGIIELGKLTNLTKLNIKVTQVTDAGIVELKKTLPNLQIMR